MSFTGIFKALAQLNYPQTVWFRGHSANHQLLPWLFRFAGALEREVTMAERFHHPDVNLSGLQALIAMHHAYLPVRLLAWTKNLQVALFCAVAREAADPAIFVLNPFELNKTSGLSDVLRVGVEQQQPSYFSDWPSKSSLPEFPIAIELNKATAESIFTVHGTDPRPIEQQCPHCVRKVILDDFETAAAVRWILSGVS